MKWIILTVILLWAVFLLLPNGAMADGCTGQVSPATAQQFAKDWIAAWNSHDLPRILEHYAEELELRSPNIVTIGGEPSGVLKGRDRVAAYWAKALTGSNLTFELVDAFPGVNSVAIHWRRPGREVIEVVEFNPACKVVRSNVLVKLTPD